MKYVTKFIISNCRKYNIRTISCISIMLLANIVAILQINLRTDTLHDVVHRSSNYGAKSSLSVIGIIIRHR